jgi:ankyrin repeat protein
MIPLLSLQGLNRVDSMGSLGHRTLLNYIESEDLAGLKNFLDSRQTHVDDRDENGTTPLMVAASKGLAQFVRELLSHGADVNAQDLDNWSALICATKAGHLEIVELLVENGADIEHREMVKLSTTAINLKTHSLFPYHRVIGPPSAGLVTKATPTSFPFSSSTTLTFT